MNTKELPPSILVTGASSGIGRACALQLDSAGYRVFATVRRDADAESLRRNATVRLEPLIMDVTSEGSIASAAAIVSQAIGESGLAGLVNNAGVAVPGPIELIAPDDLRRQFEINVFGLVRVTQLFLPLLRRTRGRIVNIGSVGGRITIPFGGALCSSKYALESINDAMRMELYAWGIHVVLIAPAGIATPAVDRLRKDGEAAIERFPPEARRLYERTFREFLRRSVAREKQGSPPEVVARAVLNALAARKPKTRYIVGHDGTLLSWLPRLLPTRVLDRVRFRIFGLPSKFASADAS